MNGDLTVGKPSKVLWRYCLPLFGSIVFQQLYNLADSFAAGRFISENALAAVGNGYEITLIFLAFAFGCNIGCSVIAARFFGAKNYAKMKTAVYTTLVSVGVLCAALMTVGFLCCGSLLRLINTPAEVLADSELYLYIYILGLPFVFYYNVATGIFSALGDSKTPFFFLAASSLANIGADILFVTAFGMGVDGVAWATFLCQGISCALAVVCVFAKLKKFSAKNGEEASDGTEEAEKTGGKTERAKAFSFEIFKLTALIAVPSILQQSFISVGNLIIQGAINSFGPGVMAGYSAAIKLNNLVVTSFTTLANGISSYTSQNLGARKRARVADGFAAGLKMVWALCVPIVALYLGFGKYLVYFFLENPSDAAMNAGTAFLRIVSPFYFVASMKLVADGVLRGAGMMKKFVVSTFTDLTLRVILAMLLSKIPALSSTGIWIAWPIGWVIASLLSLLFYRSGRWKKNDSAADADGENADKAADEPSVRSA